MSEAAKPPASPPPPRPSQPSVDRVSAITTTAEATAASGSRLGAASLSALPAGVPGPGSPGDGFIGKTIEGRYIVERLLGEGGMGIVYAGRHIVIDKRVAIKVLRGDMASDGEVNERFLQEARAASAIGNPHIVDISDFGQLPDGSTYFVMELLDGLSLSALLTQAKGPMPVARLVAIAKQIAQGLAAAHAANIIHRDLKPDNVMIVRRGTEKDFAKILDFGIAKVGSGTKRMTRAGSIFGTPHYMSPEQAAGAAVDHRTDIYALGVILYEMASGKVPFDADNFMGILTQHMYKAPVPIRALVPEVDVPPGLDAIVLKCLTKKPEGRYETMEALVVDLEKLEGGLLPGAVHEMMARSGGFNVPVDYFRAMPAPVPASPAVPKERWPLLATIGAVATLVGVAGVVLFARSDTHPAQAEPSATAAALDGTGAARGPTAATAGSASAESSAPAAGAVELAPPATTIREVLVSVTPADAVLTRDGHDLGGAPLALHLVDGDSATIVVSRRGYRSKTVRIDGHAPKVIVALELVPSPGVRPAAAPSAKAAGGSFGGVDDVGDPFTKVH